MTTFDRDDSAAPEGIDVDRVEPTDDYEPPAIVDLGSVAGLVLGSTGGSASDGLFVTTT